MWKMVLARALILVGMAILAAIAREMAGRIDVPRIVES